MIYSIPPSKRAIWMLEEEHFYNYLEDVIY